MKEISAKIIADSISPQGVRLTTFEIEYPRFILAELNTHRMLSKNTASSRAIPVSSMLEMVRDDPAHPFFWAKNQPGMQAKEEVEDWDAFGQGQYQWYGAANDAAIRAETMMKQGYHKAITNRLLEPFQWCKTVITGTEWNNFFYLRNHEAAQPEFQILARKMYEARENSRPVLLYPGEWHLPYFSHGYWGSGCHNEALEDARKISVSCCAQVSYRKQDDSLEKANKIFDMLNIGDENNPCHASPTEHQATPMKDCTWPLYATACDRKGDYWSGNLKGWAQYRQMIPNNYKAG